MYTKKEIQALEQSWVNEPRWTGIQRTYSAEDVIKLRGSVRIEYTLAALGAHKLWSLLENTRYVKALGAQTGCQAVQQVEAGLKAIYVSGWQVAGDANDAMQTYPDQSLYPVLSVPHLIQRINNALTRADQIDHMHNKQHCDWFVPIVADAEAGFGGPLNAFELIKSMIEAGASAIHLEDQLSSLKKCGHMGGKVLVQASLFVQKLITARLAADVLGVPTILIARTDADSATLLASDGDAIDKPFLTGQKTYEGYYQIRGGTEYAIQRSLSFAPYADMLWCETSKPDIGQAREFAQGIHEKFPGKWLAYNCSPSFNWKKHLDDRKIADFQEALAELGYKFQFVTLAGFHTLNAAMFDLAHRYVNCGMSAYADFQEQEFSMEKDGYRAIKHQSFVGAGYFDEVLMTITERQTTTHALKGSTEEEQFSRSTS